MTIKRMMKVLFTRKSDRVDAITQKIEVATSENKKAASRLTETIRDMLAENDRVTGRRP